jgi:hypothetical protein
MAYCSVPSAVTAVTAEMAYCSVPSAVTAVTDGMAYCSVPSAVTAVTAQRIAPLSEPEKDFK